MTTVWSATDKTSNIALTNTNHTATSSGGGNNGVRATGVSHSTGKVYMEYSNLLCDHGGGGGDFGFGTTSTTLGNFSECGISFASTLFAQSATQTNTPSAPDGHIIGIAFDFGNLRMWATFDGTTWIGANGASSPNPSTPSTGMDISHVTLPILPMTWLQDLSVASHVTLNCGDNAFTYTMPSGFVAWDAPVPIPPRSYATVMA